MRLLELEGLSVAAASLSSSSCSYVAGRSVEGLRPYCELGRLDGGGGGGGAMRVDGGGDVNGSSLSLDNDCRDELLRDISGLAGTVFWLLRRASGGGGGLFDDFASELSSRGVMSESSEVVC